VNVLEKEIMMERILKQIEKNTNQVIDKVKNEIDESLQKELDLYHDQLEEETQLFIDQELSEIRQSLMKSDSQAKWKLKKNLLEKRNELANRLFEDVLNDLLTFRSSDEYRVYFETTLLQTIENYDLSNGFLRVNKSDEELAKQLIEDKNFNLVLKIDDSIRVGGFYISNLSELMEVDMTLDTKLNDQKEWFYGHSTLIV
jgi:V/A-type H+-transporting ATPase subunit E